MSASDFSAYILAGGRSTRMGRDKAFVVFEGRSLLERALDLARSTAEKVQIVGDKARYSAFAPTVEDMFPGCGPLAGIHAALRSSPTDLNLILAVDVPFLTSALVQYIVGRARQSTDAMVTVPRIGKGWQPLCAVYRRDFANVAEEALRAGRYKIDALFDPRRTQGITEKEFKSAGFGPDVFRNLNTPEDLVSAQS